MAIMNWSNTCIFQFLDLYKNEPTLWNPNIPEHKNQIDLNDAWRRIQSKLRDGKVPIKEMKYRRDSLMSTYRRLRGKVKASLRRGKTQFKPDWPFYETMSKFLDDVYKPRKQDSDSEDDAPKKKKLTKKERADHERLTRKLFKKKRPQHDVCSLFTSMLCLELRRMDEDLQHMVMNEMYSVLHQLGHGSHEPGEREMFRSDYQQFRQFQEYRRGLKEDGPTSSMEVMQFKMSPKGSPEPSSST